jgi:hypothetical protein
MMGDLTIYGTAGRTSPTTNGMLTTDYRANHHINGQRMLLKKVNRGLGRKTLIQINPHTVHHHDVDHLVLFIDEPLMELQPLLLGLGHTNQVVDHGRQLLNLNVLFFNTLMKPINHLSYLVRIVAHKVDMLGQLIQRVILGKTNTLNS